MPGSSESGTARDLVPLAGNLFASGTFGSVNGVSRGGLAKRVADTGQLVPDWKVPISGGESGAMAPSPSGTDLMVAGAFTSLTGASRQLLGSATLGTGEVPSWDPEAACEDCLQVHVLPWWTRLRSDGRTGWTVMVSTATESLLPWNPRLGGGEHPGVWVLEAIPNGLHIGGVSTSVTGQSRPHDAELPAA